MKYSDIRASLLAILPDHPDFTAYIQSSPGTGKTSLCKDVARAYLANKDVPETQIPDRVTLLSPSTLDPVDVAGIPTVENGMTIFNPTFLVARHRVGTGPGVIIIDELDKCGSVQMQNVMATLILERRIGLTALDPETVIVATGNRVEDRAGGAKLVTHLGNRLCILDMDVSLDDVTAYFLDNGVDPQLVAFLRLRPELLNQFDPTRPINPTPRSWEKGARTIPASLQGHQYYSLWAGMVGEGAASEWVAAKEIMAEMPNPDYCILQPADAPIPEKPAARFAIATALALRTKPENFDRAWGYVSRLPRELGVAYILDVVRRDKTLMNTPTFVKFSLDNQDIFVE